MPDRRLLLVGWDAAEWRIIQELAERGLMPAVARLIGRGVAGTISVPRPLLSIAGWATIATGLHPSVHRLIQSAQMAPRRDALQPVQLPASAFPTIWSQAAAAGRRCHVVNFPATHPADSFNGVTVSNYFALPATEHLAQAIHPTDCLDALRQLKLDAQDIDAASILSFIPNAAKVNRRADKRITLLASALAHNATVHAAATWAIENKPWDLAAVCYTGLHQISHAFMPFHPPKPSHVSEEDFDLYQHVVAGAYRLQDMMLGRLLQLAGEQTNVIIVSDHGFQTGAHRPAATGDNEEAMLLWHRPRATFIAAGPDVPAAIPVSGGLLQVMPTALALLGIDRAANFSAKPLFEIASSARKYPKPPAPPLSPATQPSDADSDQSVHHLINLGYAEPADPYATLAEKKLDRSARYHLAIAHLDAAQPRHAIALLEPLTDEQPPNADYQIALANAYAGARRLDSCRQRVDALAIRFPNDPRARLAIGLLALGSRRAAVAIEELKAVDAALAHGPIASLPAQSTAIKTALGQAYLRLRMFEQALQVFVAATKEDPDSADAQSGLSAAALAMQDPRRALQAAQAAIHLVPDQPMHRVRLAAALEAMQDLLAARVVLEETLNFDSSSPLILRKLSLLCLRLGDTSAAKRYDRDAHLAAFNHRYALRQSALDMAQPAL
jgi:predicted Zn-dependent protease